MRQVENLHPPIARVFSYESPIKDVECFINHLRESKNVKNTLSEHFPVRPCKEYLFRVVLLVFLLYSITVTTIYVSIPLFIFCFVILLTIQ